MSFFTKYLKYKNKYLDLKKIIGGAVAGVVSDTINSTNKFITDANAEVIDETRDEIKTIRIFIDGKPIHLSINDCIEYKRRKIDTIAKILGFGWTRDSKGKKEINRIFYLPWDQTKSDWKQKIPFGQRGIPLIFDIVDPDDHPHGDWTTIKKLEHCPKKP
jgi:hypothetical protein